jgi:hypothetical protein
MLRALLVTLPLLSAPQIETLDEDEAVALAKQAIHDETNLGEDRLEPYQVFASQWSDSSLGCPRPGMVYLPVMTRGYRVFLRDKDEPSRLYEVHVSRGQAVVCETVDPDVGRTLPKSEEEPMSRELRNAPRLARAAREELAARLDVDPEDITVSVVPRTWLDTSLGCPKEGQTYEVARIEGFLFLLEVDDETYSYHADQERVFLCELPAE